MTCHAETPDDAYAAVRRLITSGAVDLVSFDVFDTLVWRPVAEPDHLFVGLGEELIARGWLADHITAIDFCAIRRRAEHQARLANHREHDGYECTLTDIWDHMPSVVIGEHDRTMLMTSELDIERRSLRSHPAACDLIALAAEAGIHTALVSDTYFTQAQLRDLLEAVGVPLWAVERVVVSCERRLAKYDGLLRRVIDECGVDPARTVHLGDNPVADVESATDIGAHAVWTDVERWSPGVIDSIGTRSACAGTDMGATALTRTTLLAAGGEGRRADYQFGATVGGPVLHGFARWVSRRAAELGVETVHCLLREGGVIAELMTIVAARGPRARPVHASRWVNMRAAVISGTRDELLRALARKARFRASHVVDAFGVDRRLVEQLIGTGPIDDRRRVEAIDQIVAHDELRGAIVDDSARQRRRLLRYLDDVLTPTDGRLVVCDIGWGGTIQEGLRDILLHEGRIADSNDLVGLYLMLSPPGIERKYTGQRLESYLPTGSDDDPRVAVIARNPELLEQLCTPDQGTLVDIDDHGHAVTADHDPTMTPSRTVAQRGLVDAVRTLATFTPHAESDPWLDADVRAALLDGLVATLQSPGAELAGSLSAWLHDDIAGGDVVPLADTRSLGFLSFVNAAEITEIDMRDVFWLPGAAAAVNPTLAGQLTAVAAGVDSGRLCPPSPAGQVSVAVFAPGDEDAVSLCRPDTRTGANGWSYVRLTSAVDSVRAVRIDFGAVDHLVEIDHLHVEFGFENSGGDVSTWSMNRVDDVRIRWVDGRAVSPSMAAVRAGGFALLTVTGRREAAADRVEIRCAFRASPLAAADVDRLMRPSVAERSRFQAGRLIRTMRRVRDATARGPRS